MPARRASASDIPRGRFVIGARSSYARRFRATEPSFASIRSMTRGNSQTPAYAERAMPRQIVLRENPRPSWPSVRNLDDSVAPKTLEAMRAASERFREAGIRHALVGGLAVGVHGWPRGTKDVDFLIGHEGYDESAAGIVALK